ncbi:MAG: FKBP-type peptidyl-prolyl cis-trans isomerase [Verrucomicrobiales bacterium]|nr:FKBP-type peptidyl-prolyl cis-trans isomerase [Verrucomicrobiales bacterium]
MSQAAINLAKGEKFLADNAQKEGVTTTASGLQYKVVKSGPGESKHPAATDTVLVHYKGTTIDGSEFDSSYKRGQPIGFPLNRVISGWTEGVQLMKEGDTFEFYIPAQLAYGARGAPGAIGPNETLIFQVELLRVG